MMKQTRRWNRGLQTVTFMFCVVAAVGTTPSRAAPSSLAYEGTLENAAGEPVECSNLTNCPEGLFSFTFRLYRDEVDATPLWTETLAEVPVVRGVFRVELGLTTAVT
jgi:hypothetical protein